MSIGYKGFNDLKNQINKITKTLRNNNILPHNDYESYDYYGEACNDGAPPGFPADNKVTLASRLTSADHILVNFEWVNPDDGTIHTFCQCFYKQERPPGIPNPQYGQPGAGTYDLTTSSHPQNWITSIVSGAECGPGPCDECTPPGCVIASAPAGVIKFTTSAAPDGEVDSITTTETYNDGWDGMEINIVRLSDNNVEATYTGPLAGSLSQSEPPLYLQPSTEYGIYINDAGHWPSENGIIIEQDGVNLLTVSSFSGLTMGDQCEWYVEQGEGEGDEGEGDAGEGGDGVEEPILGCTDPNASNYNPDATVDDGSCVE